MTLIQLVIVIALLALWAAVLVLRDPTVRPRVGQTVIKFTHVLPAVLQSALFAYWAIYWTPVLTHLPVIGVQLAIAYAVDFLLAWTLRRPYHPSIGPVPIVLSMNLFVWFPDLLLATAAIAIALVSKALLLAGDRHVFNPSVVGLAIAGLLCIFLPEVFRYRDISHDFDRPPHMAQAILLLALVPQVRLRITPVALGATVAMVLTMSIVSAITGYRGGPSPWWPPWLLAITLLAGDPATIPATPTSRLLFGLFLGVAFYVVSRALLFSVGTDFFSKIIPIPLANLLVPAFERAGSVVSARWPRLAGEGGSRVYLVAWVCIGVLMTIGNRS
jgi:hypothetical protein